MTRTRLELLASPVLMTAVAVLVVNDRVLKPAFHNALTGKLSDVAGVAAFALFWAALLPRRRLHAFVMTAAGFALWKSPASQPLIDAWNGMGWGTIGRVVDWTDLLALAVLPILYRYHPKPIAMPRLRRVLGPAVALACVLAFGATSRSYLDTHPVDAQYAFDLPPDSLLQRMYDLRAGYEPPSIPPGGVRGEGVDTLQLSVGIPRMGGRLPVTLVTELTRTAEGGSMLRPREARTFHADFDPADALQSLQDQVIEPLRANLPNLIHREPATIGNRPAIEPRILAPGELFTPRAQVSVSLAEAAYVAVVEVTPWNDWHVIYPAAEADVRLFPRGEHTLTTLCARTAPGDPVPPGEDVPACALARRMTVADARRFHRQDVPDPCPGDEYDYPTARIRPGVLLLIAADGPMSRKALEETLDTWCRAHPAFSEMPLGQVLRSMGIHDWAAAAHDLRR